MPENRESAILAGGCFWCLEAVFQRIDGVQEVRSGYIGGEMPDPTYDAVCSGTTGHAEAVRITFDPEVIPYAALLDVFWRAHDSTTLNRQGGDVGTQYRSAIFTVDDAQIETAEKSKRDAQAAFDAPIVTEIVPAGEFFPAEASHDDYFDRNGQAMYCQVVIRPKLEKLGLA